MSSLRAVISAASLGSRSWCVLSSPIFRSGHALAPWKNSVACDANFSSSGSCLSSEKDTNLEHVTGEHDDKQDKHFVPQSDAIGRPAPQQNHGKLSRSDNFDELFKASRRIFSPSFARDCQYRITLWQKRLREAEKEGKAVDLDKILTDSFPDVVEFSLTPLALPEVRLSVLKILLSQESDSRHSERILLSTAQDVMQLPVGIVAEIVRLLTLAPPTELRLKSRHALVTAVVNERWYEVGAKHLVFFMFQIDELFDIKAITQQLRQKAKEKEQEIVKEKKNAQKASNIKVSATDVNKSVEESTMDVSESLHTAEQSAKSKVEGKIPSDSFAPIVSVNMESRAINLANEFKVKDLARIVSLLSRWNSRNEPLLNACLHRLSLADLSSFTSNQLINLLQAMAGLSLHHPTVLDNTTRQLSSKLADSKPSPTQVCAILQSLSTLRWTGVREGKGEAENNGNIIRSCLTNLKVCQDKLAVKEAAAVLTSLANLSVAPSNESEKALISDIASLVLQGKSPWWGQIHCVWCLSILQCLDSAVLVKVLDSQFVEQVLLKVKESESSSSALTSAYKLAQVNLAASLEVKGYDGPVLTEEQLALCTQATNLSSEQRSAKKALANTLRKFVDLMTYVNLNPSIAKGVNADAVMCANSEGEVRPLVSRDSSGSAEPTCSLALQYIPFSGVNSPGEHPTGPYEMTARHLKLLGYTPVQIFYLDLKPSLSILERISNIKTRIKSAVQGSNQSLKTNISSSLSDSVKSSTNKEPFTDVYYEQTPKPS